MTNSRAIELWVGFFVMLGLAALFGMALKVSNLNDLQAPKGYAVTAFFQNVGGLKAKAQVSLAGVTIGRVTDISLDPDTYQARVTMNIDPRYKLPEDTSASIRTAGLLGEQYVGLEPGGSEDYLKDGGRITLTQSALVLEQIIGQFLYNKASGDAE